MNIKSLLVAIILSVASVSLAWAQEHTALTQARPGIPFKTEPTPLEDHGPRVLLVLVAILGLSLTGAYLLKKRFPQIRTLATGGKRMQINERMRLNPRCTLYLVQVDQREILVGQCGDTLVQFDSPLSGKVEANPCQP
jgi:flagellar biogenesis protein FliO